MAVIASFKFQNIVSLRKATRDTNRAHDRLGAGADESNLFHRWEGVADHAGEYDFQFGRLAVTGSVCGSLFDRADDRWGGMTQNHRAP